MNVILNEYPEKIQIVINKPTLKQVTDTALTITNMLKEFKESGQWTTIVVGVDSLPNIGIVMKAVAKLLSVKPLIDSTVQHTYMYVNGEENKTLLQRIAAMNQSTNITFLSK